MDGAKSIVVKPISGAAANEIVKRIHYSGTVVNNSTLHFGVFYKGLCCGAMSFGTPMDKRKSVELVRGTKWSGMIELNRMAFSDVLPRNSESRALGYVFRLMRKEYPQIKWVLSFSDATQCGDGVIYRASGFVLTSIKKNSAMLRLPNGDIICKKTLHNTVNVIKAGGHQLPAGAIPLPGYQLRYVYFLDKEYRKNLTVPEIPFSKIAELGVGMYRGQQRAVSKENVAAGYQSAEGGANPTTALQKDQ